MKVVIRQMSPERSRMLAEGRERAKKEGRFGCPWCGGRYDKEGNYYPYHSDLSKPCVKKKVPRTSGKLSLSCPECKSSNLSRQGLVFMCDDCGFDCDIGQYPIPRLNHSPFWKHGLLKGQDERPEFMVA